MSYRPEGYGEKVTEILLGRLDKGEIYVNFEDEYEFNLVNIGLDASADAMHQEDVKWLLSLPKEVIFIIKVSMSEEEWIEFVGEEAH